MRDTVDRLNVQQSNFTVKWDDMDYYFTANAPSGRNFPGAAFDQVGVARLPWGEVQMRGLLNTVDTFTQGDVCIVPALYRPARQIYMSSIAGITAGGVAQALVVVATDGTVTVVVSNGATQVSWVALGGLSYYTENP